MSNTTTLSWTSSDPRHSQLFSNYGVFYRFDTQSAGGKSTTTLWKTIRQGREDRVARLEWGPNGTLGRAVINRNMMSMSDLVMEEGTARTFNGPDGFKYWWYRDAYTGDLVLQDQNQVVIAFFSRMYPPRRYNIGDVHGELNYLGNAGQGTVLHPPLMDMVCLTAMLNRVLSA